MRAAHIIDSVVVNVIEVVSLDSFSVDEGFLVEDSGSESLGGWAEVGGSYREGKFYPYRPTNGEQSENRRKAYEAEADPIFFLIQRGEATQEEWQAKIAEIKERYPYYYDDEGNLIEAQ
jgi:hypothetical protein